MSTSPVLGVRELLKRERHLVTRREGPVVIERHRLLERKLYGYRDLLRRKLVVGRYALPGSVEQLSAVLAHVLGEGWAWGGSQAAFRRFSLGTTGDVLVHLPLLQRRDAPPIPLRADPEGAVEVLTLPYAAAWGGRLLTSVSPLLQLAELSCRPDDRSREVAASLREHVEEQWGVADE